MNNTPAEFDATGTYSRRRNFDFSTSSACSSINDSSSASSSSNTVKIYTRDTNNGGAKRKRITIVSPHNSPNKSGANETDIQQYIAVVRNAYLACVLFVFILLIINILG